MTDFWTNRWWDATVIALAINSAIFGVLFTSNDHLGWGIAVGFVPALLLAVGLLSLPTWRSGATIMVVAASVLASAAWWVLYTVALALIIVVGGLSSARIGFARPTSRARSTAI